jgi:DNA-binding MarR family transcriptional regulator
MSAEAPRRQQTAREHVPREVRPEDAAELLIQVMPKLLRTGIAAMHEAPHTAGMTLAQFKILARLNECEHRAGELAEALEVGAASLTVTADTLERRGLIERLRGLPDDRRAVTLRLTPAGQTLYRAIRARAVTGIAGLLHESTADERQGLVRGLEALQRGLHARTSTEEAG